jgi:hypothetical protein
VVEADGYWDPLKDLIERCVADGFARPALREHIRFVAGVDDVLPALATMPLDPAPPKIEKT